jgi:hypothetical protein
VHAAGRDVVEALALPNPAPRRRVDTGPIRQLDAIPGGFLVAAGDPARYREPTTLAAYR